MATDFHEIRFPTSISRGSSGGPRRRTDIVSLRSGFEERNAVWADSRREYDAGLGLQNINNLHEALVFFEARLGPLYGFRWKDWADYRSVAPNLDTSALDQELPISHQEPGMPGVYQLVKSYASGPTAYSRSIRKPVEGTVVIADQGQLLVESVDFLVDYESGLVYFGYIPSGIVTAGFEFDVPVRFTNDFLDISVEAFNAGQMPMVDVIEVKTEQGTVSTETQELAIWNWLQVVDLNSSVNSNWNDTWGTV